jgi:flagellar basal-body rod modification protein FlgD
MTTSVQSSTSAADTFANLGLNKKAGGASDPNSMNETQDRFLKLLVTQVKNQDPLNPMDQAEMTSQIAQINTVNGIEKLNATLSSLVGSYQSAESMQAAAMIGKHVLVGGNGLDLTSAGGIGGYELSTGADKLKVTIKDSNGLVVRTLEDSDLEAGPGNFFWDGKNDAGAAAVAGRYRFEIEATQGDKTVGSEPLTIGTVSAVSRSATGFELDLGALGAVTFDEIRQIL